MLLSDSKKTGQYEVQKLEKQNSWQQAKDENQHCDLIKGRTCHSCEFSAQGALNFCVRSTQPQDYLTRIEQTTEVVAFKPIR